MRKTYVMTAAQDAELVRAGEFMFQTTPADGKVPPNNPVDAAWNAMGREMGFDPDTVEFTENDLTFTAEEV